MNVMIVDDEKLARDEMRYLLKDEPDIDVVCEAASGQEALRLLDENEIDGLRQLCDKGLRGECT